MNPTHAAIAIAAVAFIASVLGLAVAALRTDRDNVRLRAQLAKARADLRAEQKTSAELRAALHDLQAANSAWTRLLRPRHLDTTRPINGGASCT